MRRIVQDRQPALCRSLARARLDQQFRNRALALPVLHTRKALARAAGGTRIIVRCTDPMSAIDIPHLAHETGARLEEKKQAEGVLTFRLVAPGPVSGER